jgi:cobalt-zinc-cadmium efflux system outer membrane protein
VLRTWLTLACAGLALSAQEPLSLDAALREAVELHPLITAADGRISTAQGLLEQASLRPNPRLTVQFENLRAWQLPYRPSVENDYFLYLSQVLETAGKRERRGELAASNKQLASIARDLLIQQTTARVRQAFWAAAGASEIVKVYEETLRNFAETVTYHENRVREGNMAEADLIRVRLEQERIKLAASSAALQAEQAAIALQREMGRANIDTNLKVRSDLAAPAALPAEDPESAVNQRAEVRLARQAVNVTTANEKLQMAIAKPDLEISGGYKRTNGYDGLLAYLSVDLPWRNKNQGNIAAAGAETRVARSNAAAAEALVRAELRGAYSAYRLRSAQLNGSIAALTTQARETAHIAQAAYREGGADLLRLLDAERTRIETELVRVQALMDLRLSEAAVQSALGVIP